MKKVLLFILAALLLVIGAFLVACKDEPVTYTVTFDSDGGSEVESQTVEEGKKATEPTTPTKAGYTFDGWYIGTEKWSFIGCVVTEDMTLTAKWSCVHTLIHNPEKASQCNAKGNIEYWSCSACSKYFSNPDATSEITYKASVNLATVECACINGKCKWCGGSEELRYTLSSDSTYYTVSGIGDCDDTDVIILKTYNGKPVTSICDRAFSNCTELTSITIPDNVTSIGDYTFNGCTGLTSVTIPNSVTSIGNSAFYVCTRLTSITIPDSITSIGNSAFYGCTGLTSITIPNSVTSIGEGAFYACTGLTSISVSEGNTAYKSIDGNLYSLDGKILIQYAIGKTNKSFAIPNSVTSIGEHAFFACTGLTSITIPNSVTNIGEGAFLGCTGLTSISVSEGNTAYKSIDGNLYSVDGKILIQYAIGKTNKSFAISNSVTSIGEYAFSDCTGLTSITIPNSVTSIGEHAFFACTGLTSITIPNSVTSIGDGAFQYCTGLTSIKYRGTEAQWKAITKGYAWNNNTGNYTVTYNYTGD